MSLCDGNWYYIHTFDSATSIKDSGACKAVKQVYCLFMIIFARLLKAHMQQEKMGVKAIVLVCAFIEFLCKLYIVLFFQMSGNFCKHVLS